MSKLNIQVNGRAYDIACDDGQEEHLQKLAFFFADRVDELAGSLGQIGDARLLLMAGLMVADEMSDAYAEVAVLKEELATLKNAAESHSSASKPSEDSSVEILSKMTDRLDAIAEKLEES